MPFFKEGEPPSSKSLARLDTLVWVLVYGGLIGVVLGLFIGLEPGGDGTLWLVGGGIVAAIGFLLIPLRARITRGR